jgi:cytochrome c5
MINIQVSIARVTPVMAVALAAACALSGCNSPESTDPKSQEAAVNAYNNHAAPPAATTPMEAAPAAPLAPTAAELVATGAPTTTGAPVSAAPSSTPQTKAVTPPATAAPQTPPSPPAAIVRAGLPAGPGRDTVQRVCTSCHAIGMVTAKGRTADGWSEIIGRMIGLGLEASDEDLQTVHAYLSRELPPR